MEASSMFSERASMSGSTRVSSIGLVMEAAFASFPATLYFFTSIFFVGVFTFLFFSIGFSTPFYDF